MVCAGRGGGRGIYFQDRKPNCKAAYLLLISLKLRSFESGYLFSCDTGVSKRYSAYKSITTKIKVEQTISKKPEWQF